MTFFKKKLARIYFELYNIHIMEPYSTLWNKDKKMEIEEGG